MARGRRREGEGSRRGLAGRQLERCRASPAEQRPRRRSHWRIALLGLCAGVGLALFAATADAERGTAGAKRAPTVIVLSLDGVRHDYPERGPLPAFERIARAGGRAERLLPVLPASTFPNHVSIATGTYPDRHGIVANRFRDAQGRDFAKRDAARWIEAEPVWIAAERQGKRAATFFWVGSETDWRGRRPTYRRAPFDAEIDEHAKVAQILAWLDLPQEKRPALIMSWWHGADGVGHVKGPDHPDIFAQLASQDAVLGKLLEGLDARALWPTTTLLVVSDHGMTSATESIAVEAHLADARIEAEAVLGSGVAHFYLEPRHLIQPRSSLEPTNALESRSSDLERALALLRGLEGVEAYAGDRVPERLRLAYPGRVGDIVSITAPPRTFEPQSWWKGITYRLLGYWGWTQGHHGYAVAHPDQSGIFYAVGRGVPSGTRWDSIRNVDLAATIARLLDIAPPAQSEGVPIAGIASPVPTSAP